MVCFCRYLSEDGLKKLNENGLIGDVKELTKRALAVSFNFDEIIFFNSINESNKLTLFKFICYICFQIKNISPKKKNKYLI